ncbi:MAG TPA: hypothetical protein VGP07_16330 [Polyangia bacterium]|jgi:anti-sigma factor RsiW
MDCREARDQLALRGVARLEDDVRADVAAHLGGCATCRRAADGAAAIDDVFDRLPRRRAPPRLARRIEALLAETPETPVTSMRAERRMWSWAAPFVSACAAATLVLVLVRTSAPSHPSDATAADLAAEAVNDHLRVVGGARPIEIESGGIHQVKPWFTGRVDFAPRVAFSGDDDFPLLGGNVGYFRDRKAAVFVFKRRLHTISLLVFPVEGLPWSDDSADKHIGRLFVDERTSRGFNTLLWRDGDLGYALVSDVNSHDLEILASKINDN